MYLILRMLRNIIRNECDKEAGTMFLWRSLKPSVTASVLARLAGRPAAEEKPEAPPRPAASPANTR